MATSQPPVSTSICVSSPSCSISGAPAFTTTYTHKNVGTKAIWALVRLWSDYCNGFVSHDLQNHNRRRGLPPTILSDDWDEEALDLKDTELWKLDPGQVISKSYTFTVNKKLDGFISSDVYKYEVGKKYLLDLCPRRWRWVFADDLPNDAKADREITGERSKYAEERHDRLLIPSSQTSWRNKPR